MIVRLQAICSYSLAQLSAFADYSWRSRRTGRKMRKMRHKNWKTYLNLPVSINEFMYGTKKKERGEHLCSLLIQRIMQSGLSVIWQ